MNLTDENNFAYLLELMPALHNVPEYAWLPELFSIIGAERLITLCKYAGGEYIRIPTIEEIALSIKALQVFYNNEIKHTPQEVTDDIASLYAEIKKVFNHL